MKKIIMTNKLDNQNIKDQQVKDFIQEDKIFLIINLIKVVGLFIQSINNELIMIGIVINK